MSFYALSYKAKDGLGCVTLIIDIPELNKSS